MLDYMLMAAVDPNVRTIISNILVILMSLISIAIVVIVMMQEGETGGVSAISGGTNETYLNNNKGATREQKLKRATLILGAVMLVLSVVFFIVKPL